MNAAVRQALPMNRRTRPFRGRRGPSRGVAAAGASVTVPVGPGPS
jgi:hypothetical protein